LRHDAYVLLLSKKKKNITWQIVKIASFSYKQKELKEEDSNIIGDSRGGVKNLCNLSKGIFMMSFLKNYITR
jgi:hypothetical protein